MKLEVLEKDNYYHIYNRGINGAIIFYNDQPFTNTDCHNLEAFGPVSTIMPYKTIDDAIELSKMGKVLLLLITLPNTCNCFNKYELDTMNFIFIYFYLFC